MGQLHIATAAGIASGVIVATALGYLTAMPNSARAEDDPPYTLLHDGFFYVGGTTKTVDGHTRVVNQMYVEFRIPAQQTHPYPIVMVHGGTRSGTTYTGTPDGREGWAQYFVRRGYAVYVVDQPGRARSGYSAEDYGPSRVADMESGQRRYLQQEKYNLWPQAHLHTQWPGSGAPDDPISIQMVSNYVPEIEDFTKQQFLNRDALVALFDKIGPAVLMAHSQAGAFAWPVADVRPQLVKAIIGVEPNGPPFYEVNFTGPPSYFRQGKLALPYGLSAVPLTYSPPIKDSGELTIAQEEKPDAADLVRCWMQSAPARQLPNLQKMPIMVLTSEASYHAPYDHCTVKYLVQAGVKPTHIKLADLGIRGNSHVMMNEKNSKDIAAVIAEWLDQALPAKE